jgi:archaellin
MAIATLATTRYTEVGTYIGQFFLPGAGSLPNEARVVCLVGRGDRNIMIKNQALRRSFVYEEVLSFTTMAPFIASTDFPSDGSQSLPTVLRNQDGIEISANKWAWVESGGQYTGIQLIDSAWDPLAIYYLSYQSTSRGVVDPIPAINVQQLQATAEVREILSMGVLQDQQEFEEYRDFVGSYELDTPVGQPSNSNPSPSFSVITPDAGVTGSGIPTYNSGALYSHSYNRLYTLACTASAGTAPNRTATLEWTSTPVSMGNNALPSVPMNPAESSPELLLDEAVPASISNVLLELGVALDFDFGLTNFTVGDTFFFQGNGLGLIEIDPLLINDNQFTDVSVIAPSLDPLSTGSAVYASSPAAYAYTDHNLSFRLKVISISGVAPARTATMVWAAYGSLQTSGSFTIDETAPTSLTQALGSSGIELTFDFGAINFVVDDMFSFVVAAPRTFYKGKEAVRDTDFTVGLVSYPAANRTTIAGSYLTNTPEGRFGNWSADTDEDYGRFELPDGLRLYVRNAYLHSDVNPTPSGSMLETGDVFNMQARFHGELDWSLMRDETQTFGNPSEIARDVTGSVTGTVGANYIILENTPSEILSIKEVASGDPVPYTIVTDTSYVVLTDPAFDVSYGDLIVEYRWRGGEPAPGQVYYMTAKYLRPSEFYNRPILFLSKTDALTFLSPSTVRNDIYIGADVAWDYDVPWLFVIQVRDSDDDGSYSKDDFKKALAAFRDDRRTTDLVVLNHFQSLPDQLQIVNISNDPFELHECMTWVGAPIGTPVGSELEIGSLVFVSRKALAVYGQSPAHGTRVLVGPTRATRTITLEDKSSTSVTLDGSFVAAALASLNSSFADPKETLLLKQITSFDTMETYTDPENLILGGNNVIFFADEGSGIYRAKEDITTDSFSPDTNNINQMVQKQFVTRDMRNTINNALISLVFPSADAGIATLQGIIVSRLSSLVSNSLIGDYQDDAGTVRDINPDKDALVFRDPADPTLFHIGYNYFLATTAKRVYGLYTVNLADGFPR